MLRNVDTDQNREYPAFNLKCKKYGYLGHFKIGYKNDIVVININLIN